MVKPITVLKILHCRNLSTKSKNVPNDDIPSRRQISQNSKSNVDISKVIKTELINEVCRVCLKHGTISIHGDNPDEDLAEAISAFGGIEVNVFDSYPKYLCQTCHALLQGAILFKKTAQQSEQQLKMSLDSEPDMDDHFSDSVQEDSNKTSIFEDQKTALACKQCDIQFDTLQEYDNHRYLVDHEEKKMCPVCSKFYSPGYLKKHMEIHKVEPAYICDVCGKNFRMQNQFTRHRLTHFYSLPFKCSLCPYKGRFTESLKMHMRSHTGEKPYVCDECPQRFINKSNLKQHMLRHKKKRDFTCECGRGYYTKRDFEMHFKVEHAGIKDQICKICGKAFGYRKQLTKHQLKVHKRKKLRTGRMPIYLQIESMNQEENDLPILPMT